MYTVEKHCHSSCLSVHLYVCPTDQLRRTDVYFFQAEVCDCAFFHQHRVQVLRRGVIGSFSASAGRRAAVIFQRLGAPLTPLSLTAVLQLAVYYCRGPQLRPPGAYSYMPILLLTVGELCVGERRRAGAQSDTFQQPAVEVCDETCSELCVRALAIYRSTCECVCVCVFICGYRLSSAPMKHVLYSESMDAWKKWLPNQSNITFFSVCILKE